MPPATSNLFTHVRTNKIVTVWIFVLFIGLFSAMGLLLGVIWGDVLLGVLVSLAAAGLYALIVLPSAEEMILGMTKAKPVTKTSHPILWNVTEGVALAAGIPMPKLYVIEDSARNAFATGTRPENGVVVVTTGLLQALDRRELEGVIAHEVAHIRNRDIMVMLYAAVLVGAIMLLSDFLLRSFLWGGKGGDNDNGGAIVIVAIVVGLVLAILAPLIAELIRLAVSRRREYLADADAVVITRNPTGLRRAFEKIAADPDPLVDTANKATAHLFISTPFRTAGHGKKRTGLFQRLFSTHPPIEERIELLKRMGG
jgi:heat shock protein HtpX